MIERKHHEVCVVYLKIANNAMFQGYFVLFYNMSSMYFIYAHYCWFVPFSSSCIFTGSAFALALAIYVAVWQTTSTSCACRPTAASATH
jgi:hypothetical protein